MDPKHISINEYDYDLPESRIAMHPLGERDASKLLIYKAGNITQDVFSVIDQYLPGNTLLVFNDTKVIHARIRFAKTTGTPIEIFCLEPHGPIKDYSLVMNTKGAAQWNCLVGGAAKWKTNTLEKEIKIGEEKVLLKAEKKERLSDAFFIQFSWLPAIYSFAEIIEAAGNVPLPPYIKRDTGGEDESRYQTIFARAEGSVAAPTAGLHFSASVFEKLTEKNIQKTFVTLHVGAGTFKPVKADTMSDHEMHSEYMEVSVEAIEKIKDRLGNIGAVGTTSLRSMESLYWLGVKAILDKDAEELSLQQWEVYEERLTATNISAEEALTALLNWLKNARKENIFTKTQILIAPGYRFRIANLLITNFHQPRSTLLLLVAAAIGDDWKKMYEHAMKNDFRFLSYGDGNLLFIGSGK